MAYDHALSNSEAAERREGHAPSRGIVRRSVIAPCRLPRRPAFTLIEVLLVLALLVIIGAMTMPVLTGTMARSNLRNAAEVIRTAWQRARLTAMETGQIHVFRCELNGRQFHVISMTELLEAGKGSVNFAKAEEADDTETYRLRFDRLSSGIMFAGGQISPSPQLASMYGSILGQEWSSPIVFQPDGTCNDATVLLTNEEKRWAIRVTIRGLTGTARIGDVTAEELK